ncbi:MAG: hypothetical protein WCI48_04675 [Bacteroidota bacterium]|jgi:hypothetical protein
MKSFAKPFIFILCITFLYSCSNVPQLQRTKVIGSWKLEKLVSIGAITDSTDKIAVAAQHATIDPSSRELKPALIDAEKGNFSKLAGYYPDLKEKLEFNADNTASVTMNGKPVSGTWKMNKKKSGVIFTSGDKSKTITINISEAGARSMRVDEPTFLGLLWLTYEK